MTEPITSLRNPKLKLVRALRRRRTRDREALFVAEGIRHVGEALEAGVEIEFLLHAPDLLTSDFARALMETARARKIPVHPVEGEAFSTLTGRDRPQGLLAVLPQRWTALSDLTPEIFPWGVAMAQPQDPGNVGTVLRTLDAVGAHGLVLLDGGVDPFHPTAVRASMGTLFWHPLVATTTADFAAWVEAGGYHVYGTSATGESDYRAVTAYHPPALLLLGDERRGLDDRQRALCTRMIRLPLRGRATSLNVAVAAGVLLYRMAEQLAPSVDASLVE